MKVQLQIMSNGLAMRSMHGVDERGRHVDDTSEYQLAYCEDCFFLTIKPERRSQLARRFATIHTFRLFRASATTPKASLQCSVFFLELPASRRAPMKIACQIAINTLPSRSTEVRARLAEDHRHTRRSKCNKASLLGIEAESHQPGWRICGFCRKLRRGRAGCLLGTAQAAVRGRRWLLTTIEMIL